MYYQITQSAFVILTIICLVLIFFGLKTGLRNKPKQARLKVLIFYSIGILLWIVLLSVLSLTGFVANFSTFPPRLMLVLVPPLLVLLLITRSSVLNEILSNIPPNWLVYIQSFRIVVEILLWLLFLDNLTPVQMTFEGRNFDILVGLTALIAAPLFFDQDKLKNKWGITWNVFGLALLLNILVVAILSFPTPFRYFMNEPANIQVAEFPIIFLPGILVPIAYYMHVLSIKQLLLKSPLK